MHVIPQSWAHWHILIGVFPSIGLAIILGFFIAGLRGGNEITKQLCLAFFALLALLSIPIYFSGTGAESALSGNTRFSKDMIETHEGWAIAALVALVLTGIVAAFELWRRRGHNASKLMLYAVLAVATVGLALAIFADELGFQINHNELRSGVFIQDISTPPLWPHAHIVLNHIPTAGFVFALAFFAYALFTDNNGLKRGSLVLFVICSVAAVPTYVAGTAAMWALTQPTIPEISKAVINAHRDMALWTLFGCAFTGAAAWIELWRSRSTGQYSQRSLYLILLFAVITLGIMTETGHRGGLINHPEIVGSEVLASNADAGISASLETTMKEMIWFVPWQTVHFFGYCLIFGAAFAVGLRVLGFWKSLSFAAMHRLLLLGFLGVLMNVFSGMLMMFSDSYKYVVNDVTFAPKIAFLTIGTIAVLYFSVSDRLWNVKAGESASITAKLIGAVVLLAWVGVIVCGRLLPFL